MDDDQQPQTVYTIPAPKLKLESALNYKRPETSRSTNDEADDSITISDTRVHQLSLDSTERDTIALIAKSGNTGTITVGKGAPSFPLSSSQILYITKAKLSSLYFQGTNSGDIFYYIAGGS